MSTVASLKPNISISLGKVEMDHFWDLKCEDFFHWTTFQHSIHFSIVYHIGIAISLVSFTIHTHFLVLVKSMRLVSLVKCILMEWVPETHGQQPLRFSSNL